MRILLSSIICTLLAGCSLDESEPGPQADIVITDMVQGTTD